MNQANQLAKPQRLKMIPAVRAKQAAGLITFDQDAWLLQADAGAKDARASPRAAHAARAQRSGPEFSATEGLFGD